MAERSISVVKDGRGWEIRQWTGLTYATTDSGEAYEVANLADKTVIVTGTFGTGGAVTIQGSLDGTNWKTLNDPFGTAMVINSAASAECVAIAEHTRYVRPLITAGDGATSLTVTIMAKGKEYE